MLWSSKGGEGESGGARKEGIYGRKFTVQRIQHGLGETKREIKYGCVLNLKALSI